RVSPSQRIETWAQRHGRKFIGPEAWPAYEYGGRGMQESARTGEGAARAVHSGRGIPAATLSGLDRGELARLGKILDLRPASLRGRTVAMELAGRLLRVRTREGWTAPLRSNAMQQAFERRRDERNIVLKARQMGMTT